jgi:protein-S-isoprenylcysteine O-methyltransferase Ste14
LATREGYALGSRLGDARAARRRLRRSSRALRRSEPQRTETAREAIGERDNQPTGGLRAPGAKMNDSTRLFIQGCWIAWLAYWVLMAFATKRTVERTGFIGYRVVAVILVVGLVGAGRLLDVSSQLRLWQTSLAAGVATDCIVLAGAAFSVWARITLGRNWSAEVTFKQDHELIESGPYALVRHPIYTGIIAMGLGTAINYGRVIGFVLLVSLCGAFWWKALQEERIMSSHFPDAYAEYKKRVRAIIPFVL